MKRCGAWRCPFDPLDCVMSDPWPAPAGHSCRLLDAPWRTAGDTVERIEVLAGQFVAGERPCPDDWLATRAVLDEIETRLKPSIVASGPAEIAALLTGLDGRFVAPGPSGAPTRGRPDVLPTGRNFYSVDSRAVPTPAACELGKKSAELLIRRYLQDHGDWPTLLRRSSAWGTANMRTGGDDIAQALALIGAKPRLGPDLAPRHRLRDRPAGDARPAARRRDAPDFRLLPRCLPGADRAVRQAPSAPIGALDEADDDNPIAARMRTEAARLDGRGPRRPKPRRYAPATASSARSPAPTARACRR